MMESAGTVEEHMHTGDYPYPYLAGFHILQVHPHFGSHAIAKPQVGRSDLLYHATLEGTASFYFRTSNAYSFSTVFTGVAKPLNWLRACM
jgi:hypothetical protein